MNLTVCITGASKGLGFGLIEAFLADPVVQIVAVTRNQKMLEDKLSAHPSRNRVHITQADIGTDKGRTHIYEVLTSLPPLSVLIHNAGLLIYKPFVEISEEELKEVYSVNVFAPFLLTQKLIPLMHKTHTIYISSVGGVQGSVKFSGLSAYSTSKAAVNCLTEMLTEEFKETDNVFNCLALGSVNTEMFQQAFPGFDASSDVSQMAEYIVSYAKTAPSVMRGKIISLSLTTP